MHEMSIATSLLAQILEVAERGHLQAVDCVRLEVGVLRLVVPEALVAAFAAAAVGTLASHASLEITEVPIQGRCRSCGRDYRPAIEDFRCPACGRAEPEILAGDDIVLASLSGEGPEEGTSP